MAVLSWLIPQKDFCVMPMGLQVQVLLKLFSVAGSKCGCMYVKDGGSPAATKKPPVFCSPAGVMATALSFLPQESVFLFYFHP